VIKRAFDIILASVALVILSPVLLVVALYVARRIGRPVLFVQERAGLHGRPFRMYKFRTMTNATDASGQLLPDAERLPPAGQRLRATSLDELPEIWNIVKGDMSLVGPRPLLMRYLPRYSAEQARRHDVRPGLTGHAQVNGRNSLSWDDKFALDVWYVDHRNLWLDLKILVATVVKIFDRSGISGADTATMNEFMGAAPKTQDRPPSEP
jgi:lipopolysaccharide/colanic/teichoic acid biosynthesis glycosyltransferase